MSTECTSNGMSFQGLGRRRVEAAFDGGHVSSDGGALLLREAADAIGLFGLFSDCFTDGRDQRRIEHTVEELVAQRILGLALGYEDVNDHSTLRDDPLLALAVGKPDPLGKSRARARDQGRPLASHSTLHRLENAASKYDPKRRDLKILHDPLLIEDLFVDIFLDAHADAPESIVLDVDGKHDPLHGNQEGRFYHGYYGCYCYLPLYIFCGDHLLASKLRTSDREDATGALDELVRVVGHIRSRWPEVKILLRGDSGFCRVPILRWCEETKGVDYVIGLAKNSRLKLAVAKTMERVVADVEISGKSARCFEELQYKTLKTWEIERRVVAKVEAIPGKANHRFIVTSLSAEEHPGKQLYEDVYCIRGDMENRLKEQQLGLFASRTSASKMRANQLRLFFSSIAYVLLSALRRLGLQGTELAKVQAWTLRTRLLKVGAVITISVRRVRIRLSSAFPLAHIWRQALHQIHASAPMVF